MLGFLFSQVPQTRMGQDWLATSVLVSWSMPSVCYIFVPCVLECNICLSGIVADVADGQVSFHNTFGHNDLAASSASSFVDTYSITNPFDFSVYMDQVS